MLDKIPHGTESVAFFFGIREDFKQNRLVEFFGRNEVLNLLQVFFLCRSSEIFKAQILRVMTNQIVRLVSEVTCCGNKRIGVLAKDRRVVIVHSEFGAAPVVYHKDAQIFADVTIAQRVHVVKERQIAENAKMNSLLVGKRHSQNRR